MNWENIVTLFIESLDRPTSLKINEHVDNGVEIFTEFTKPAS